MIRYHCDACLKEVEHFDEMNQSNGMTVKYGPPFAVGTEAKDADLVFCEACRFAFWDVFRAWMDNGQTGTIRDTKRMACGCPKCAECGKPCATCCIHQYGGPFAPSTK